MDANTFLGAIAAVATVLALVYTVLRKPEDPKEKAFVGALTGLFLGMLTGSAWIGADIIWMAFVEYDELIRFRGNVALTYAISTTISGAIGGVTGATIGVEKDTNNPAIIGAVIGAIVGIVFVRIALLI